MKALKGKKSLAVLFSTLFLITISFGLYGCAKKSAPTAPTPPAAPAATTAAPATAPAATTAAPATAPAATTAAPVSGKLEAAAMNIIDAQGCAGCHVINGKGGSIGPSLSQEGTKGHSIHWLEVQINTPKTHNPKTMMPNHNLNPKQLKTVAEFLEASK